MTSPPRQLGPDKLKSVLADGGGGGGNDAPQAAVAAVFRARTNATSTELLFIQRAARDGDPWSGQMAFPGGRAQDGDSSTAATAERETAEEVGLDLAPARRLGSLPTLEGGRASRHRLIAVACHCYWLAGERPSLTPNHEVSEAMWVPVSDLCDPGRYIDYTYHLTGMTFPGIQLNRQGQVIWGLTLRLLADLFDRLDLPFIIKPEAA